MKSANHGQLLVIYHELIIHTLLIYIFGSSIFFLSDPVSSLIYSFVAILIKYAFVFLLLVALQREHGKSEHLGLEEQGTNFFFLPFFKERDEGTNYLSLKSFLNVMWIPI